MARAALLQLRLLNRLARLRLRRCGWSLHRLLVGMLLRPPITPCFCSWQQDNIVCGLGMKMAVFEAVSGWQLPLSLPPDCQL